MRFLYLCLFLALAFSSDTGVKLGWYLVAYARLDEAIEVFDLNTEIYPDNVRLLTNLGEAHRLAGHVSEAIRVYEGVLALNPENASVQATLKTLRNE